MARMKFLCDAERCIDGDAHLIADGGHEPRGVRVLRVGRHGEAEAHTGEVEEPTGTETEAPAPEADAPAAEEPEAPAPEAPSGE